MTISQDDRIKNFEVVYEEQMMAPFQNHTKHDIETKNFTNLPLLLREIDAEKTLFQPVKTQKMTST
jgi:hypothetical protein